MQKIIRRICSRIERLSFNRFNIIKTLYINFRCLPFEQAKKLPIHIFGSPYFNNLSGRITILGEIKKGMIKINETRPFAPSLQTVNSQLLIAGELVFRGPYFIGTGTKILVAKDAKLVLGSKGKITDFVNLSCWSCITIGDMTRITHRCQINDSNNHFIANMNNRTIPNDTRPIYIGNRCFICNNTSIMAGSILPNNVIVGSSSLINKDFSMLPETSLIAGIPAKCISTGYIRIYNEQMELDLIEYYKNHNVVYDIPEDFDIEQYS